MIVALIGPGAGRLPEGRRIAQDEWDQRQRPGTIAGPLSSRQGKYDTPVICPPWWPLPDVEPIGDDRAREFMAYLKSAAPAVVAAASAYLIGRHPRAEIQTFAITTATLAKQSLSEHMRGVSIGAVSVPGSSGRAETVGIAFTREGRVAWTVAVEGSSYQEWRVL